VIECEPTAAVSRRSGTRIETAYRKVALHAEVSAATADAPAWSAVSEGRASAVSWEGGDRLLSYRRSEPACFQSPL
jgi:hypothetical protein